MRRGTMIKSKKQFILKIFIGIIISTMLYTIGFSCILQNGSGRGYGEGGGDSSGDELKCNSTIITTYIIEGAGYYLDAHSYFNTFLNRVELSEIRDFNYIECNQLINSALDNIKYAKETYYLLIEVAEITPYNQTVISKLNNFDYNLYMNEHTLNSVIFKDVENYLKNGDIRGVHKRIYSDVIEIEKLLISIKNELSLDKMPDLSIIWKLNEAFSDTLIFGQYVARVFYAIL
jgi:hypothetical protein